MRGLGGVAHALLQQAKIALGVISKRPGTGTANTALVYHAKRLMSLHEGDLPYAVGMGAPAQLRGRCAKLMFFQGTLVCNGYYDYDT